LDTADHQGAATAHTRRARLRLIALLAAVTSLSQFFRASSGAIAPELIRELALSPELLGLASGAFFIALGVAQVPVGMLFDRIGARRTVAALSVVTVAGALLHVVASSGAGLIAARAVLGLGNAASFMSVIVLCARWFPADRLATVLSWIFAVSQAGILLAATPLAALTQAVGWRWAFAGAAALAALVGAGFLAGVRDEPPGAAARTRAPESLADLLRGVAAIWRIPDITRVLAIHMFAYASMITVLGLWAGPYLNDVHGLDPVARGNVLLAMGVAQAAGMLAIGPLDRRFNTRKWIIVPCAAATIAVLLALAAVPRPPAALAIALLVALCAVASFSIVIVTHGRSLFPDALAGRGVTTVNLAQVTGAALLPIATGAILGSFALAPGRYPAEGYRVVFAVIAAALAGGLAIYARARDAKPRPPPAGRPPAGPPA
jgi:predicted MFS family arabinose efflux permease